MLVHVSNKALLIGLLLLKSGIRLNDNLPPHHEWKYAEIVDCGGNEETAGPFLSLQVA